MRRPLPRGRWRLRLTTDDRRSRLVLHRMRSRPVTPPTQTVAMGTNVIRVATRMNGDHQTAFSKRQCCVRHTFCQHGVHMSNTSQTVDAILANPEAHGFRFVDGKVSEKDATWRVPLVEHLDVDKLIATFGKASIIASLDGTSRHVTNQRIARDLMSEDATTKPDEIKRAIVENWLGMKSRRRTVVTEIVYEFGGVKYANRTERDEAARRAYTEDGYPENIVEKLVARLGGTEVPSTK